MSSTLLFYISCGTTALTFLAIGFVKGKVAQEGAGKSALVTLLLGAAAASLAYVAGNALASWLGVQL